MVGRHVFSPGWAWPGQAGTWMLQFLTLAWNTEEKAFGLLGEPKEGSPGLSASSQPQHGAVSLPGAVRA